MNASTARQLLQNSATKYPRLIEAAAVVCEQERPAVEDLLTCLDRGGLPAEMASMRLYEVTGRKPADRRRLELERDGWVQYFKAHPMKELIPARG